MRRKTVKRNTNNKTSIVSGVKNIVKNVKALPGSAKRVTKKAGAMAKKVGKKTNTGLTNVMRKNTPIGVLEQVGGLIDDKYAQHRSKRNLKKIQKKAKKK